MRERLARSYDHNALTKAAKTIESPQARGLAGNPHDPRLVTVATSFRILRQRRERADYALNATMGWQDAEAAYSMASKACAALKEIGTHRDTSAFLLAPWISPCTSRG